MHYKIVGITIDESARNQGQTGLEVQLLECTNEHYQHTETRQHVKFPEHAKVGVPNNRPRRIVHELHLSQCGEVVVQTSPPLAARDGTVNVEGRFRDGSEGVRGDGDIYPLIDLQRNQHCECRG